MTISRLVSTAATIAALAALATPAGASQRAARAGQATARTAPRTVPSVVVAGPRVVVSPRVGIVPYRPYYYPRRPGLTLGFYPGYPYGYYPYGYGYGYYGGPYGYPSGYVTAVPGQAYGGVRIVDAPRDAQVFADGYYVGVVDDFDGVFQQLNFAPGPHRIEIRAAGRPPMQFDVRVEPGQTITYHAR